MESPRLKARRRRAISISRSVGSADTCSRGEPVDGQVDGRRTDKTDGLRRVGCRRRGGGAAAELQRQPGPEPGQGGEETRGERGKPAPGSRSARTRRRLSAAGLGAGSRSPSAAAAPEEREAHTRAGWGAARRRAAAGLPCRHSPCRRPGRLPPSSRSVRGGGVSAAAGGGARGRLEAVRWTGPRRVCRLVDDVLHGHLLRRFKRIEDGKPAAASGSGEAGAPGRAQQLQ